MFNSNSKNQTYPKRVEETNSLFDNRGSSVLFATAFYSIEVLALPYLIEANLNTMQTLLLYLMESVAGTRV